MIAIQLTRPAPIEENPLTQVELPKPIPGPGQVRLKVSTCGVCHTDLHLAEGEIHPKQLPIVLGHQVVGIIDAATQPLPTRTLAGLPTRQTESTFKIGQRVGVPWLSSACGTCEFCKKGRENLCPNAAFTGFSVDGGFAEYMLADARYILPIPDTISDEQAAPLLCAGIVGYRSLKKADILPGDHVGLFGFGASAHICIQILHYWGCRVSVFTRAITHQQHARELGAVWAGSAGQSPKQPLDRAVIFAPSGPLVVRALETIRPGGTVAINAIHMSDIPSFPYDKLYGERTLRSVANATYQDGEDFLALAVSAGIQSTINPYSLAQANQALQDLKISRFNGEAVLKVN